MIKVAYIDFHYNMLEQEHGSAQKVIQSFLDNIQNFEMLSVSVSHDRKYIEEYKNKVKYYVVPEDRYKNRVFNKLLNLNCFTYSRIIKILNREKPQILHFHNRHELVDKILKMLKYKPKVICHYHLHFKKPIIPNCCDRILGVSKATQEYIVKTTNTIKKSSFVLNPVSFDLDKVSFDNTHKIQSDNEIKLLFGAGTDTKKGYNEIVEALKQLELLNIKYKLFLCGNITTEIDDTLQIEKMGFVSSEKFYSLMQVCDILLFPSYFEPFGLTVLEGMYNSIKVLPSKCGGIIEILGEEYPYYCEVKNSDTIVDNIIKLENLDEITEKELFQFYNERLKFFSPTLVANRLENQYKEVLSEN